MRAWLFAGLLLAGLQAGAVCKDATDSLKSMVVGELKLEGPAEQSLTLTVRVADDARKRGAGFQYICPETVAKTSIYFVFDRIRRPSFHMRNVRAPLDIAFIDGDGLIVDIQRMEPYVLGAAEDTYYSPPGRVAAALETRAGYFSEKQITAGNWRIKRLQ